MLGLHLTNFSSSLTSNQQNLCIQFRCAAPRHTQHNITRASGVCAHSKIGSIVDEWISNNTHGMQESFDGFGKVAFTFIVTPGTLRLVRVWTSQLHATHTNTRLLCTICYPKWFISIFCFLLLTFLPHRKCENFPLNSLLYSVEHL